jgi:hypothetical protein
MACTNKHLPLLYCPIKKAFSQNAPHNRRFISQGIHIIFVFNLQTLIRPKFSSLISRWEPVASAAKRQTSYRDFKIVHSVHCLDQHSQLITPTKCTVIFTYKCYTYSSDMFRCWCNILREHRLPNIKPTVIDHFYSSTICCRLRC